MKSASGSEKVSHPQMHMRSRLRGQEQGKGKNWPDWQDQYDGEEGLVYATNNCQGTVLKLAQVWSCIFMSHAILKEERIREQQVCTHRQELTNKTRGTKKCTHTWGS